MSRIWFVMPLHNIGRLGKGLEQCTFGYEQRYLSEGVWASSCIGMPSEALCVRLGGVGHDN